MSAVIHKYPLVNDRSLVADVVDIELPRGAKVVHVAGQDGAPTIWVEKFLHPGQQDVNKPLSGTVMHRFHIIATGQESNAGHYIGTAHTGYFVWHIYEEVLG